MKIIVMFFCAAALVLGGIPVYAANKVVVIPLSTSSGGPGDWTSVSVSSLAGVPRTSTVETAQEYQTCTDVIGRYASTGQSEFLVVPIELPDGATITAVTAVICDNTPLYGSQMYLYRSDAELLASLGTSDVEAGTTVFTKTTTNIYPGTAVVDNSQYSYFMYMEVNGTAGNSLYPISGIVTLQ